MLHESMAMQYKQREGLKIKTMVKQFFVTKIAFGYILKIENKYLYLNRKCQDYLQRLKKRFRCFFKDASERTNRHYIYRQYVHLTNDNK